MHQHQLNRLPPHNEHYREQHDDHQHHDQYAQPKQHPQQEQFGGLFTDSYTSANLSFAEDADLAVPIDLHEMQPSSANDDGNNNSCDDNRTETINNIACAADALQLPTRTGILSPLSMASDSEDDVDNKMANDRASRRSSSVSSTDSNDNNDDTDAAMLLEQCIQSGMHKQRRPASSASTVVAAVLPPIRLDADAGNQPPPPVETRHSSRGVSNSSSDDDDNNDDGLGDMLAACINMGMHKSANVATTNETNSDVPSEPSQPIAVADADVPQPLADEGGSQSNDSSDSSDDDDLENMLRFQQCIQQGMTRRADGESVQSLVIGEQPNNTNATSSALPLPQPTDDTSSDDDDETDLSAILQQAIALGSKGATTGVKGSLPPKTIAPTLSSHSAQRPTTIDRLSDLSDSSTDLDDGGDNDNSPILAQCIQLGMHKPNAGVASSTIPTPHRIGHTHQQPVQQQHQQRMSGATATNSRSRSTAATPTATAKSVAQIERERHLERERQMERERQTERERERQAERERRDKDLLLHCIQATAGMNGQLPPPMRSVESSPFEMRMVSMSVGGSQQRSSGSGSSCHNQPHQQHQSLPYQQLQQQQYEQLQEQEQQRRMHHQQLQLQQMQLQKQQQHQHHHHRQHQQQQFAAAPPMPMNEYNNWHGVGVGGGSLRRHRDDPLPPLPPEASGSGTLDATGRNKRRVKKRSSTSERKWI